jgi:hypothetical protein
LWRCGDGLVFEVPLLASDLLLTTLHPLLENVLQNVCRKLQEDSGTDGSDIFMVGNDQKSHGARSGLYDGCFNGITPISVSASTATLAVCGIIAEHCSQSLVNELSINFKNVSPSMNTNSRVLSVTGFNPHSHHGFR